MRTLRRLPTLLATLALCICGPAIANAQNETQINYQGYLTDAAGAPVTGLVSMTMTLYDATGNPLWTETHPDVTVDEGRFMVILGSLADLPETMFTGEPRYLGITVGGDPEISPRTLLTSVPAAASSRRLIGDVETGPGQLALKNLGSTGQIEFNVTSEGASGVFDNAEEFEMAGNLTIVSDADESGLLGNHGTVGSLPDIELKASAASNFLKLHPPDPCVPPDPCEPALELAAEPDKSILRLHPPDPCVPPEPCIAETFIEAGPLNADFDIVVSVPDDDDVTPISIGTDVAAGSSHLSVKSPDGLAGFNLQATNDDGIGGGGVAFGIFTEPGSEVMGVEPSPFHPGYSLMMYDPSSATPTAPKLEMNCGSDGTGIDIWDEIGKVMGIEPSPFNNGYAMKLFDPHAAVETPIVEISSQYGDGAFGKVNVGWTPPPDDNHPGVEITSTPTHGKILVGGTDDGTGAAKMIVLQANSVAEVGIGTDAPSEALHVVGNGYFTGDIFSLTDTKAKTNVVPIDNALDKVEQLNGVTYDLQGEVADKMGEAADGRKVGFLAHNVEQVLPEAVKVMNDGNRAVDYSRITALLVEAVKDLKAENEALRSRVEALEGR